MGAMVGIDPASDGLRRAQRLGVPTTADVLRGLIDMPEFDDIAVGFRRDSATAHLDMRSARAARKKARRPHPVGVGPSSCRRSTCTNLSTPRM